MAFRISRLRVVAADDAGFSDLVSALPDGLSLPGIIAGEAPGAAVHDTSLYKGAAVPVLVLAITSAALGMAEAALAAFKERLPGREIAYTEHEIQIDSPTTHCQVADAATRIHVARLLLHRCADDIEAARSRRDDGIHRPRPRPHGLRPCRTSVHGGGRDPLSRLRRLRHYRDQPGPARLARPPCRQHARGSDARNQPSDVWPHLARAQAQHTADLIAPNASDVSARKRWRPSPAPRYSAPFPGRSA